MRGERLGSRPGRIVVFSALEKGESGGGENMTNDETQQNMKRNKIRNATTKDVRSSDLRCLLFMYKYHG